MALSVTFDLIVEGVLLVLVCLVGLTGNTLGIYRFSRISGKRTFHLLMLSLAVFDSIYLIDSTFLFGLPHLITRFHEYNVYNILCPILLPLAHIGLTGSIYLTLAVSVERYITVCHPFFKMTHSCPAYFYIIPISFFSIVYNVPKFLELETVVKSSNITSSSDNESLTLGCSFNSSNHAQEESELCQESVETYTIAPTPLRVSSTYIQVYIIYMNFIVHGILPLGSLLVLNTITYIKLRRMGSEEGSQVPNSEIILAQVGLAIVAVFIICHSVKWIPNIYEFYLAATGVKLDDYDWPDWVPKTVALSHLLMAFNCSVTFYIYLIKRGNRKIWNERQRKQSMIPTMVTSLPTQGREENESGFEEESLLKPRTQETDC